MLRTGLAGWDRSKKKYQSCRPSCVGFLDGAATDGVETQTKPCGQSCDPPKNKSLPDREVVGQSFRTLRAGIARIPQKIKISDADATRTGARAAASSNLRSMSLFRRELRQQEPSLVPSVPAASRRHQWSVLGSCQTAAASTQELQVSGAPSRWQP